MFLDPSASHLIINTTLGENYYLHTQSRQPRVLSRLKGVGIESIAWNPSLPTASTREILIGASDGNIYETYIEISNEFYRREERYLKSIYKIQEGPVTGLYIDLLPALPDIRRVVIGSRNRLYHLVGRIGRAGSEGSGSIFTKLFEAETPTIQESSQSASGAPSALAVSPDPADTSSNVEHDADRTFSWLSGGGILHGTLQTAPANPNLGHQIFSGSKNFERSRIPPAESSNGRQRPTQDPIEHMALTQWHILCLIEGRIVAINKLNEQIVYDQIVLERGQKAVSLMADLKKNTFWLITSEGIFEVVVTDEDRDAWKIFLERQNFDAALKYARGMSQKDAVATASGDYLIKKGQFLEAANVYGKSSKAFEQVALTFIDQGENDALRKYLLTKLSTYNKSSIMQRIMIASWLIELFMSKLNTLDDTITTKAELEENITTTETKDELKTIRGQFQDFVNKYKGDLDRKTTYEIISSHGREQELLSYATSINDYNFVLSYWIQRERWTDSLNVLKRQTDPSIFYKYSSVLMTHVPTELVDVLTRHPDLNPRNLIPALLNYSNDNNVPIAQNQAARYLLFCINQLNTTDAAIHNTLISIYAAHPSSSESALLSYLSTQSANPPPSYDADFALRLCIQHSRIQSCVHIYSLMGQYTSAVTLALKHNEIELASLIADRPSGPSVRKKLWLAVAKKVISQNSSTSSAALGKEGEENKGSIKTALEFLKRCPLLRIEDLIPFFPDFVIIDDFKDEICAALESYSQHIDALKSEMDDSAATAESIKADIVGLDKRYAIVEPGESCRVCGLPLLSRQFFVFPSCQHGFHSDCLGRKVLEGSGLTVRGRIRELQGSIGRGVGGRRREREVRELDALVGKEWYATFFFLFLFWTFSSGLPHSDWCGIDADVCESILCNDFAIKMIEEPFISATDDRNEWAV